MITQPDVSGEPGQAPTAQERAGIEALFTAASKALA